MLPPDPQKQSSFAVRLPSEIRHLIYLELWRSCGLRQHILWHRETREDTAFHFCRWTCTTEFSLEDQLQPEVETERQRAGVPLGTGMWSDVYGRRLHSTWLNHWPCSERAVGLHGPLAEGDDGRSSVLCWRKARPGGDGQHSPSTTCSPYIPMLLSCKLISSECVASIYQSTTFIFTDMATIQAWLGFCQLPPFPTTRDRSSLSTAPPHFFTHARNLELSLVPNFPLMLFCSDPTIRAEQDLHDVYDFHWLQLHQFQSLKSLKIWMSARGRVLRYENDIPFVCIAELDIDALKKAMKSLSIVESVVLSTPLRLDIGSEEDGYVDGIIGANAGIKLWKRGTGDRFHPDLRTLHTQDSSYIFTSPNRQVRVARFENLELLYPAAVEEQ